jgi:hypothetical protein
MIYIEGWVEKKTKQSFPIVWKRRYAVLSLRDGNSTFEYFEADESNSTLKGSISLFSSTKIRIVEQQHLKKKYQIIIYVDTELSFKIALENEVIRAAWLSAFQRLLIDAFDHLDGNEEHLSKESEFRTLRAVQEGKETLRELLVSTSLYRRGAVVGFECYDRIVCLDPADLSMYDLALADKASLRASLSSPRRGDVPILTMHLHGSLEIPTEVVHKGLDHIIDLRTPESTLRIMFCSASTANAWLSCLVELRNAALDQNRQYQASGLTRLLTMMPTANNTETELPEEIVYNVLDYDMKSNTDADTVPTVGAKDKEKTSLIPSTSCLSAPPMYIAILVVGTRGDVQPFVYLGLELQRRGHTVRIATHQEYREFIIGEGLLFFPLGGDPRKLSSYMVKTKGRLIPDFTNCEFY